MNMKKTVSEHMSNHMQVGLWKLTMMICATSGDAVQKRTNLRLFSVLLVFCWVCGKFLFFYTC